MAQEKQVTIRTELATTRPRVVADVGSVRVAALLGSGRSGSGRAVGSHRISGPLPVAVGAIPSASSL